MRQPFDRIENSPIRSPDRNNNHLKIEKIISKTSQENYIPKIHNLNPIDNLEKMVNQSLEPTNRESRGRLDAGISEIIFNVDHQAPPTSIPRTDLPEELFYSRTGLRASVRADTNYFPNQLLVDGQAVVLENGRYTNVDFSPQGKSYFDPSKMTKSLTAGVQGMIELLDAVDHGVVQLAPVFIGITNLRMAIVAQRLGFSIVDGCKTPDGEVNKNLQIFTVVGKIEDIRNRVNQLRTSETYKRLTERAKGQRVLSPKLQPALGT